MSLNDRSYGYEFTGYERNLLFNPNNKFNDTGYVRYSSKQRGEFFLDPSPDYKTHKEELYILKDCKDKPPPNQLIEAVVRETGSKIVEINKQYHKITFKYVSGWDNVDPKKILGNEILNKEEFLATLSSMMIGHEEVLDLRLGIGMFICSSPQLSESEIGGIDTTVVRKPRDSQKWTKFTQITKIIPPEYRKPSSRVCYFTLDNASRTDLLGCCELNRAYNNAVTVPVHIPLPFTVEFKKTEKKDWESQAKIASTFMMNSHLFQPEIPDGMEKKVHDAMHNVNELVKYKYEIPYFQDIGSVVPRLTTSICRLNFGSEVTSKNLEDSLEVWSGLVMETFKIGEVRREVKGVYNLNDNEIIMLSEIKHMNDTGMEITVENLKKITRIWEWDFDQVLNSLSQKGHIYFPHINKIRLIER
ncbi:MAG: hypothetical protein PHY47_21820 [Lachnospiraceae bacterium]|nr:hypothetical protein [Lachnospiraceae bacterium]MDD4249025.1 hypothetical protein [Methanosarcina sp.]